MDLDEQLKNWELNLQWDKIIETLSKIKPIKRTPKQDMFLAAAYVNSSVGNWTKRRNFLKAIKLLQPLEDELGTDFRWYLLMGNASYYLNEWTRAALYFEIALEMEPPKPTERIIRGLLYECERNFLLGKFFEPFEVRVRKAWKEFQEREQEIRSTLKNATKHWLDVSGEVQTFFELAVEDVSIFVDFDGGKWNFIMEGNGNPLRMFELQYIKDHAPEEIKRKWSIYVGSPVYLDWLAPNKADSRLNHLFLWEEKEEEGIITLNAFCDNFDPAEFEPLQTTVEYVKDLISSAVGRCVLDKYLIINEVVTSHPKTKTFPLKELSDFLRKRGIDTNADSSEILNASYSYTRTPKKDLDEQRYRDDIISGNTLCMKELLRYEKFDVEGWEQLEADGVAFGSLFYRLDNFTGENRDEQIKEFRENFKKALLKKAGPDAVKIIGEAHGRDFDYIDLLAWNSGVVFKEAQEYLKTTSVPFSGYHPMRRDSGNILLTGENRWIKHYSVDSSPSANPFLESSVKKTIQ